MEINQILETIRMVEEENLDIRTITMGISLLDCIDADIDQMCEKIYQKITTKAKELGASWRTNRNRIWYSNHQQANLCYPDCHCCGSQSTDATRLCEGS